jgi:hypothetical protein
MITEEAIEEALSVNTVENFRTETLCQWIDSLQSPWPHGSVEATSNKDLVLSPGPLTVMAFDISPSRRDASLVMGQVTPEGKFGVCVLETFSSPVAVDELAIAAAIKKWCDMYYPRVVCFDKYTTASVASRLERSGVAVRDISGQSFYQATAYLRNTDKAFTDVASDIGGGVFLTRPENLGSRQDVGVEATANGRLLSTLRYSAGVNVFRQQIDSGSVIGGGDREATLASGRLSQRFSRKLTTGSRPRAMKIAAKT